MNQELSITACAGHLETITILQMQREAIDPLYLGLKVGAGCLRIIHASFWRL